MKLIKPIFIIGIGRSGSTIFYDVLSRHIDLVWLSRRICNRYPNTPQLNKALMRIINYPLLGKYARRYFEPGECYGYWDTLYRGFSGSYRDLERHDVTERARKSIRQSLSVMITKPTDRLVIKITGWNRMRFLHEVFPDALFIHVERDPRAVINSFLNVSFWSGWKGTGFLLKDGLNIEQRTEFVKFKYSFVALAGMKLVELKQAYIDAKNEIPNNQLLDVSYESLCSDPILTFKQACDFCGLDWNNKFEKEVTNNKFKNTNYKWQVDLSDAQQRVAQYYYEKLKDI